MAQATHAKRTRQPRSKHKGFKFDPAGTEHRPSEAPKASQDRQGRRQERPRAPQELHKSAQERPNSAQRAATSALRAPESAPRAPKSAPRSPASVPRVAQERPKTPRAPSGHHFEARMLETSAFRKRAVAQLGQEACLERFSIDFRSMRANAEH